MAEALDPEKYHVMTTRKRNALITFGLIFVVFVLPVFGYFYYKAAVHRPAQTPDDLTLVIESGEGVSEIAQKLYEHDAINSQFLFAFYVLLNGIQNNIQAGTYVIPAGTSTAELAKMLQTGIDDKSITFIEGWRLEEFAQAASELFDKVDYVDFVTLVEKDNLEGQLFPDTYRFDTDVDEEELVATLVKTFNAKTAAMLTPEKLQQAGLTKGEALIFASIVEREISNPEDMPVVAGILIKRYRNEELIGADATTQYAAAAGRYGCTAETVSVCPNAELIPDIIWWPDDLTTTELETQNPYNTRAVVGLPPGPISNPGLAALEAVLNHVESPYNYYLTDKDGVTRYAETLDEHNVNVELYL